MEERTAEEEKAAAVPTETEESGGTAKAVEMQEQKVVDWD